MGTATATSAPRPPQEFQGELLLPPGPCPPQPHAQTPEATSGPSASLLGSSRKLGKAVPGSRAEVPQARGPAGRAPRPWVNKTYRKNPLGLFPHL